MHQPFLASAPFKKYFTMKIILVAIKLKRQQNKGRYKNSITRGLPDSRQQLSHFDREQPHIRLSDLH